VPLPGKMDPGKMPDRGCAERGGRVSAGPQQHRAPSRAEAGDHAQGGRRHVRHVCACRPAASKAKKAGPSVVVRTGRVRREAGGAAVGCSAPVDGST
jgi:hypothetical protein